MGNHGIIIFGALILSLVASCYGEGLFSDLKHTLTVSATPTGIVYLRAGVDQFTVTWGLNRTMAANLDTTAYKNVEVKLCYLPESQKDRPWRRNEDELSRDKACQFTVVKKAFSPSNNSETYTVKKDVPTAHYFLRVYVRDGPDGKEIAYGETTGLDISVKGFSGRSTSIDVAASVFSGFSVLSLVFFYFMEKRKAKRAT